jgi:hypothetical protein
MRLRLLGLLLLAACAKKAEGTLTLTTGLEADALTRDPPVKTLVVEATLNDGGATPLARVELPATTLDLGDFAKTDVGTVDVRGEDATGRTVVAGSSLPMAFATLESASLPVFLQRKDSFARLPAPFAETPPASLVALVGSRYVIGIEGKKTALYDLATLLPVTNPPTLPTAPRSLVVVDSRMLSVTDDPSSAIVYDVSNGQTASLAAPAGSSFADVAGGSTIYTAEGTSYVVGGTRTSAPSSSVLVIALDGTPSTVKLTSPRQGAAAAYVKGRGVVVLGGSATAAGAELVTSDGKSTPLPFPADPSADLSAKAIDDTHVLVAGGSVPLRVYDIGCGSACSPTTIDTTGLGTPTLQRPSIVTLGALALVAGDGPTGTRVFAVEANRAREITVRVPRAKASLVELPTKAIALVGGAREIEAYRP